MWDILYTRETHRCGPWATSRGGYSQISAHDDHGACQGPHDWFLTWTSSPDTWAVETHLTAAAHMAPSVYNPRSAMEAPLWKSLVAHFGS